MIVKATIEHLNALIKSLPRIQIEEIVASHGRDVYEVVKEDMERSSSCLVSLTNGVPTCMAGIIHGSLLGRVGNAWLITGENHAKDLVRFTKQVLDTWALDYDIIFSYVYSIYPETLRWAKLAGFEICPPKPYGKDGELFNLIIKRNENGSW